MKIAITGASGLIGTAASERLRANENDVVALARGDGTNQTWNPGTGALDESALDGCDALVHLAAENVMGRWTNAKKARIANSRIAPTEKLSRALAALANPPRVLISASASGFYGDRGDEILDENSASGNDFLSHLVLDWENATRAAQDAGIRVVHLRLGVVLSERGGAFAAMLPAFRLGLGSMLGDGRQWWRWITLDDVTRIIEYALKNEGLSGAINVVAPQMVTNREFTRALNGVLHRPNFFPIPASALQLAMGEASTLILSSARVMPQKLLDSGFEFQYPKLNSALRSLLNREDATAQK